MARCSILLALLSVAATPLTVAAQSAQVVRLDPRDDPSLEDGQIAIIEGAVADKAGRHYTIQDVSILQPIAVTLLSPDEHPTLEMSLHVSQWNDAVRTAALQGTVGRTLKFRTQGSVGIKVQSPDGRPQVFDLVAWVGSEIEPQMEAVVVSPREYRGYAAANPSLYPSGAPEIDARDSNSVLVTIAMLLAGILVLLAILVFRKAKS